MKSLKTLSWLILVVMTAGLGYLFGSAINGSVKEVQAQDEQKSIKLTRTIKPQLQFTELKIGGQGRNFDESFKASSDWIKQLSFKLENISEKPIVYLKVNVNFPETRATGNLMSYAVSFGTRPDAKTKKGIPMLLKPGETLDVALDKEKDKISKFVSERQSLESLQKVELEIGYVIFEDKTAWAAGTFLRQDPANPGRYKPLSSEQMPPNQEEE